jgi:hypothetical protein
VYNAADGEDQFRSYEDALFVARMDPPTTLSLVARIRELEEQLQIADEQATKTDALVNAATRWDGAKYSKIELDARNAALEEAAVVVLRMSRTEPAGGSDGCGTVIVYDVRPDDAAKAIRALKTPKTGKGFL